MIPQRVEHNVINLALGGVFGTASFLPDGLGVFLAAVATVIGSLAVIFSVDYMQGEQQLGRYYAFVLFFIGAMVGLVLSSNLLLVFVFWEITALCSYALISFHNDDPKAVAGGIKALIITQVGGIGLLAGALCSTSSRAATTSRRSWPSAHAWPAGAARADGLRFPGRGRRQVGAVPVPDLAAGRDGSADAGQRADPRGDDGERRRLPAGALLPGLRAGSRTGATAVMAVGVISALLAAIMALVANDLKRVLAYSTVSQLGYMVYAIGAGGIFASQFHLLSHAVFKALLFLAPARSSTRSARATCGRWAAWASGCRSSVTYSIIGALALAGLPIVNGFWSKELVLEAG